MAPTAASDGTELWLGRDGLIRHRREGGADDLNSNFAILPRRNGALPEAGLARRRRQALPLLLGPGREVTRALWRGGLTRVQDFNLLAGMAGEGSGINPVHGRNRRQAVLAFPLFSRFILFRPEIRALVDDGAPFRRALATALGVARSRMDRLSGITLARIAPPAGSGYADILAGIDPLPTAWLPRHHPEWQAFWFVLDAIRRLNRWKDFGVADTRGAWLRYRDLFSRQPPEAMWDAIESTTGILARIAVGEANAGRPSAERMESGQARDAVDMMAATISERFFQPLSVNRLARLSHVWHAVQAEAQRCLLAEGYPVAGDPWPALFDPVMAPGGLRLVPLTCGAALAQEGARLNHCVATYRERCRHHHSHIISVRDEADAPLSTIELRIDHGRIRLEQHFGHRNAPPPGRAVEAVAWLMAALGACPIATDGSAVEPSAADPWLPVDDQRRIPINLIAARSVGVTGEDLLADAWSMSRYGPGEEPIEEVITALGWNNYDARMRRTLFGIFQPVLPRVLRNLSYDGLFLQDSFQWVRQIQEDPAL